jgi:hypothetical protein
LHLGGASALTPAALSRARIVVSLVLSLVLSPLLTLAAVSLACAGCATAPVDPAFFRVRTVGLVSVYAPREIPVSITDVMWMGGQEALGEEVVEMTLGDTEDELALVLGVDSLVPVGKAMEQKSYNRLPELVSADDWSQVNRMIAVDIDDPAANLARAAVATDLGVDAVAVLRHEWTIARDRFDVNDGVTTFDRCTLVVVDRSGRRVLGETQVAQIPMMLLWNMPGQMGINGAFAADETRRLARSAAHQCLRQIRERIARSRTLAHSQS